MKHSLSALLRPVAAAALACASIAACATPIQVKLIAFNDFHGNLQSPGTFGQNTTIPSSQRPPVGGADYLGAWVAQLRAQNPNTVVVGAGDFISASPLISALFYDEPTIEVLNKVGVDFTSVGNHEFDHGVAELQRMQSGGCKITNGAVDPNSCKGLGSAAPGSFDGAKFKYLSANVIQTSTGKTLFPAYGIKTFNGVKIAFIGMTLKGTPSIVTPSGVAGLQFNDEADTVNALVPKLRAQGIEAIVVLVHQGGFQNTPPGASTTYSDINGCDNDLKNTDGTASDVANIVSRLDDAVDLVVSAHTHAAYNCSANTVDVHKNGGQVTTTPRVTGLPNSKGRLVPVTSASAFGRIVTDIDLTLDSATRDVVAVAPTNRLVDETDANAKAWIAANPTITNIVAGYNALVSPLANQVIGTITQALPNSANSAGEMPAGDVIADAQLAATQPAQLGGAVVAFMNAGGVRSPGFVAPTGGSYPYNVTYGNAFTVQPFGNSLVTLTLTAQQLKDLLEQQFPGCMGQTAQRVMQVSNGLKYTWSASAAACSKIQDVWITPTDVTVTPPQVIGAADHVVAAGVVQNPAKTYRVTVNNFMATGGDGFTVLLNGQNPLGGAQDIDALTAYLQHYNAPMPAYTRTDPTLGLPRITQLP
jgi:5'-nucleotidase